MTADLFIALLELKHPIKQVLRCPRCGISLYVHEDRDTPIERCPRCLNGYPGYPFEGFEEITYEEARSSGLGMVIGRAVGGIKVVCGQCKGRTTRPALEKYGGVCAKCGKAKAKAEKAKAK